MPPPIPFPAHVKQAICDRLAGGETLKAICASEGMPTTRCVGLWARADATFATAMRDARARGAWKRRGFAADEGKAREIVRRVAAGQPLHKVLQQTPGMPSRAVMKVWRAQDPFLDAELRAAWRRRREGESQPRRALKTFDQAVADRILVRSGRGERLRDILRSDPAFPCLAVLERWRWAEPGFDADLKACMRFGAAARSRARMEALLPEIAAALIDGGSLRSLAQRWAKEGRTDRPALRTLYSWIATRPSFVNDLELACQMRDEILMDDAYEVSTAATPASWREARRKMRRIDGRRGRLKAGRPGRRWRPDDRVLE